MIVNRAKLASIFAVSLPTIDAWRARGMPFAQEGGLGKEWAFETIDCCAWWAEDHLRRNERSTAPPGEESFDEADRRKMVAAADMAELELAKKAGLMVDIMNVAAHIADIHARVRNRLLSAGNHVRTRARALVDRESAEEIVGVVEAAVLEAMEDIRESAI